MNIQPLSMEEVDRIVTFYYSRQQGPLPTLHTIHDGKGVWTSPAKLVTKWERQNRSYVLYVRPRMKGWMLKQLWKIK